MTHRTTLALVALSAASALAGCNRAPSEADASAEVRKAALGVIAAYNAQDAHATAAYDAPDYVGIYHGSANVIGPAADEAGMKAAMAAEKLDWRLGPDTVTVGKAGDIGIFEAPYNFTVTSPKGVSRESGTWVAIFRRQPDGSMKLWRSIASDLPAEKAPS
jgi:ketosteroid isomerase-like protein